MTALRKVTPVIEALQAAERERRRRRRTSWAGLLSRIDSEAGVSGRVEQELYEDAGGAAERSGRRMKSLKP